MKKSNLWVRVKAWLVRVDRGLNRYVFCKMYGHAWWSGTCVLCEQDMFTHRNKPSLIRRIRAKIPLPWMEVQSNGLGEVVFYWNLVFVCGWVILRGKNKYSQRFWIGRTSL
jgi:hypothetical protein